MVLVKTGLFLTGHNQFGKLSGVAFFSMNGKLDNEWNALMLNGL